MHSPILIFYRLVFIALAALVIQQSLTPLPAKVFVDSWDKGLHLSAWLGISLSGYLAYGYRHRRRSIILLIFIFSALVESGQLFVDGRYFSLLDIIANAVGCLLSWGIVVILERFIPAPWRQKLSGLERLVE
jgi:VanZ family protein